MLSKLIAQNRLRDKNMTTNVGRVRLRNISELQTYKNDQNASTSAIPTVDESKTPEKRKKAGKVRAATTAKKRISREPKNDGIIITSTAIKRTAKKEPLPGQQRIDSFFKSATKTYKTDAFPKTAPQLNTPQRIPRRGCKRLFDDGTGIKATANTSLSLSDIENDIRHKVNCSTALNEIIDLCSDGDSEGDGTSANAKPTGPCAKRSCESEALAMRNIPDLDIKKNIAVEPSTEENMSKVRKRKRCPPYKVIEDTTFVVDGFQFGDIPNATHYFLTHYHADHYVGLTKKFAHPLYMTPLTARLVRRFINIDDQYIHEIEVDNPITVNDIEVTAIDANHCPGAAMLLFKLPSGKCILHTGDFRASFDMESLPVFWNYQNIDVLYLDTTYLSKNYDFCHQSDSIYKVCSAVEQFHERNPNKRILHVCGAYLIGKEKVWMALLEKFGLRVWTEPNRRKAIDCLDWPELKENICNDPMQANLHVINLGKISYPTLDQYFKQFEGQFDMLLGIRPSGWEKNSKPSFGKRISVIGIEYSEHSSYLELERFVRFLNPKKVISTVPVAKDLCITAKVPSKWYNYKGYGRMLSTSYQPSITTFLNTPHYKKAMSVNTGTKMILSPPEDNDNLSSVNSDDLIEVKEESDNVGSPNAAKKHVSRLSSDASNDMLSLL